MKNEQDKPKAFVCYSRTERDSVKKIIQVLRDHGIRIWWDDTVRQ